MELNTIFHKSLRRHERRQLITILSAVIATAAFFAVQASLSRYSEALSSEPLCGMEEHMHTDACYDETGNLICTIPQHVHTEECYQDEVQIKETEISEEVNDEEIDDKETIIENREYSEEISGKKKRSKLNGLLRSGNTIDFGQYITNASIARLENGHWVPKTEYTDGDIVQVSFNFTIPSMVVTPDNPTITYTLPEGINIIETEEGPVIKDNTVIGHYSINKDTRIIEITYFDSFASGDGFDGDIFFEGTVSSLSADDSITITIPHAGTITVNPSSSAHDISVLKTGTFDNTSKEATYVIEVSTTKGTKPNESISITDRIETQNSDYYNVSGSGEIDSTTIVVNKVSTNGESSAVTGYSESATSSSFEIGNLPALNAGEKYVVTYTVKNVSASGTDGSGSLRNYYGATSGDLHSEKYTDLEIQKSSIYKSGGYDYNTGLIGWTVTINDAGNNLKGKVFQDTIPSNVQLVIPEGGIRITRDWQDVGSVIAIDDTITYAFSQDNDDYGVYRITYYTTCPTDISQQVTNTATFDDKTSTATVTVPEKKLDVYKEWKQEQREQNNKTHYYWKSTLTIPQSGIPSGGIVLSDTILPPQKTNGTEITGAHYALYGELKAAIESGLSLFGSNQTFPISSVTDVDYSVTYFGMDGSELTGVISDTEKVSKFSINVKSASDNPVTKYYKIILDNYPTVIDTSTLSSGSSWSVSNVALSGDKSSTATHHIEDDSALKKMLMVTDQQGETDDYQYDFDELVNNKNLTLKYKILIDRFQITNSDLNSTYAVSVTDELPAGTELVDGSVEIKFGKADGIANITEIWDAYGHVYKGLVKDYSGNINPNFAIQNENGSLSIGIKSNDSSDNGGSIILDSDKSEEDRAATRYIIIEYALRIVDEALLNGDVSLQAYENTVTWGDRTTSQKTTVVSQSDDLWKTGKIVNQEGAQPRVRYSVVVNKSAKDLDSEKDTIELLDTLETNASASLNVNSLKVYRYSETAADHLGTLLHPDQYTVSYSESDSKKIKITLPDSMALVIVYDYFFDTSAITGEGGTDEVAVKNTAELNGQISHHTSTKIKNTTSGSTAYQQNIIIQKVDSNNVTERLTGATFELSYWNGTDWVTEPGRNGFYLEKRENDSIVYDGNGNVVWNYVWGTSQVAKDNGHELKTDRLYKLKEKTAPNGYVLSEDPYYFIVKVDSREENTTAYANANAASAGIGNDVQFFGKSGGNLIIPNEKDTTGIGVKKVWKNTEGEIVQGPSDKTVTVQLYKVTGIKKKRTLTVTINGNNWGTKEVPLGATPVLVIHQTKELYDLKTPVKVNEQVVTIDEDNYQGEYIIPTVINDTTINVTGDIGWVSWNSEYADNDYEYSINYESKTPVEDKSPIELPYLGKWSYFWEGLPSTDNDGNNLFYIVEETEISGDSLNNYIVTYEQGIALSSGSNEVITNQAKDTYIMPETGGNGTLLYRIAGVLILLTGGILLLRKGVRDP